MTIDFNKVIRVPEKGLSQYGIGESDIANGYDLKSRIRHVLIPESVLKKRITAMAVQISRDYRKSGRLYLVPILKGAFVFAADLGREILRHGGPETRIDFYETETYGAEIKKCDEGKRQVKILRRPRIDSDSPIILIDDVADTVQTLTVILKDMSDQLKIDQGRIRVCFLLDKFLNNPHRDIKELKKRIKPDYIGFEVPDVWVAGYGIDAGEDFRFLSCVVSVKEEFYF